MDNKLTNLFTYLKSHKDYVQAFDQLKRIFNPYFENISNYNLIEKTFIEFLIPVIHYFDDNRLESRIYNIQSVLTDSFSIDNKKDFKEVITKNIVDISIEINTIRNDFTCLRYFNVTGVELKDQDNFSKKARQFLEDIQIWKLEGEKDWYEGQYEWNIEYEEILNIAYHCNSLKEVNDVYKLVWFLWVGDVYPKGIHHEAKIIWENLSYWKNIIDNIQTEKPLHIKPNEALHEVTELDDDLSIKEKLEALKRKFSK